MLHYKKLFRTIVSIFKHLWGNRERIEYKLLLLFNLKNNGLYGYYTIQVANHAL